MEVVGRVFGQCRVLLTTEFVQGFAEYICVRKRGHTKVRRTKKVDDCMFAKSVGTQRCAAQNGGRLH